MREEDFLGDVSTGFPSHFTGGCFTLKMYLSRFTQLLVNVSLEIEIYPRCSIQKLKSNTN